MFLFMVFLIVMVSFILCVCVDMILVGFISSLMLFLLVFSSCWSFLDLFFEIFFGICVGVFGDWLVVGLLFILILFYECFLFKKM